MVSRWQKTGAGIKSRGQAKVFIYDIATKVFTQLSKTKGIQTEPVWAADGKSIIYTSDLSGSAQIYEQDITTKKLKKLTEHGNYNVSPSISKSGNNLAYLTRIGRKLQTVILDQKAQEITWIGSGVLDDTPRLIEESIVVYAHSKGSHSSLTIGALDGSFALDIVQKGVHLKFPTWL